LEIAPDRVDPNVHPNKKEVHFLDQDEIVERICDKLNVFLAGSNSSRSYNVQVSQDFTCLGDLWDDRLMFLMSPKQDASTDGHS
jgi:DNA mismatch repair protein MLH1